MPLEAMSIFAISTLYALGGLPTAAAIAPWTKRRRSGFRLLCIALWPFLALISLCLALGRVTRT